MASRDRRPTPPATPSHYSVNIAGGFRASQLTSDYVEANGIYLPTKRRAYTRGPDPSDLGNADGIDLISARFCSNSEAI